MILRARRGAAFHRTKQASAECFHRKLQREVLRRMLGRELVRDLETMREE